MPDKQSCSHPRMCPGEDSFSDRIKREKLSLEPPPPAEAARKDLAGPKSPIQAKN